MEPLRSPQKDVTRFQLSGPGSLQALARHRDKIDPAERAISRESS